jgi:ribonuclease D
LKTARSLPEAELPPLAARYDGPPPPRTWADKDPVAARRLSIARTELAALAAKLNLPVENLLTPDFVRRLTWEPPEPDAADQLGEAVADQLQGYGARPWQIELATPLLEKAIIQAASESSD